ncbi:MAG TPA: hypothetical protein VJP77_01320 [Planctomycetota bacterium]|nr:hypothetical protein [Planctomycetota bacterium]
MLKYSKKLVQIPEEEYLALLRLFTGDNSVVGEKVATDFRIAKVLNDKKLSQLVKGKRYQTLARKRKLLREMGTKKKIEGAEAEPLPTSGVVPTTKPVSELTQAQEIVKENAPDLIGAVAALPQIAKVRKETAKRKKKQEAPPLIQPIAAEVEAIPGPSKNPPEKEIDEDEIENEEEIPEKTHIKKGIDFYNEYFNIVKPNTSFKELKEYIMNNKEKYLITKEGTLHSNKQLFKAGYMPEGVTVTAQDLINLFMGNAKVTDKLTTKNGQAYKAAFRILRADEKIRKFLKPEIVKKIEKGEMIGRGKNKSIKGVKTPKILKNNQKQRYIIDSGLAKFKPIEKTKGLVRKHLTAEDIKKRKFKPILWSKIGV